MSIATKILIGLILAFVIYKIIEANSENKDDRDTIEEEQITAQGLKNLQGISKDKNEISKKTDSA